MLQTHGTFFQLGTRSLSLSGSLNCRNSCSKKKKKAQLALKTRKKEDLKRNRECSVTAWIDNEHSCNVLKAFVPYRKRNSLEMTSTHILAVLIYQAQLWCWPSAESLGSLCCNKPQQWARGYTLISKKSHQPVPVAHCMGSGGHRDRITTRKCTVCLLTTSVTLYVLCGQENLPEMLLYGLHMFLYENS